MKRRVLVAFHYAADGIRPNLLKPGRFASFAPEHAARFEAEGKVEPALRVGERAQWVPSDVVEMTGVVSTIDGDVLFLDDCDIAMPVEEVRRLP